MRRGIRPREGRRGSTLFLNGKTGRPGLTTLAQGVCRGSNAKGSFPVRKCSMQQPNRRSRSRPPDSRPPPIASAAAGFAGFSDAEKVLEGGYCSSGDSSARQWRKPRRRVRESVGRGSGLTEFGGEKVIPSHQQRSRGETVTQWRRGVRSSCPSQAVGAGGEMGGPRRLDGRLNAGSGFRLNHVSR
jgi:hypothetical protein